MGGNQRSNMLVLPARAKVNLYLEVGERRNDGYHDIDTVMAPLMWSDTLTLALNSTGEIRFSWHAADGFDQAVPVGDDNLVVRAVQHLRREAGEERGLDLRLIKRVPVQAGLGGASSNAAAALRGAARLWGIDWPSRRFREIAANIGSDVPFFLQDGPARCRGRGEIVETIPAVGSLPLVLVQPPRGLATADVYRRTDELAKGHPAPHGPEPLLRSLAESRLIQIASHLFNRLESAATSILEEIYVARRAFSGTSALAFQMSGSGSCCFGLFGSRRAAVVAAARLAQRLGGFRVITCLTSGSV